MCAQAPSSVAASASARAAGGEKVARLEVGDPPEARHEVRRLDLEPPEREVGEIRVERGVGMAPEEPAPVVRRVRPRQPSRQGDACACIGVAVDCWADEQQRGARVIGKIFRVNGKIRQEKNRGTVGTRRGRHMRDMRMAFGSQCPERPVATNVHEISRNACIFVRFKH